MKRSIWLLLALIWPVTVQATEPTTDCVVSTHQATWDLKTDGSADVLEQLSVNCGSLVGKHGIYRIIPTRVPNGSRPSGYRLETSITNIHILDGTGNPYPFERQTENGNLKLKIGDANVEITGQHDYVISYRIANAVWPNEQGEGVVDLNVVGQFWQLPIDQAEIEIVLPGESSDLSVQLARGGFGSTDTATTAVVTRPAANMIKISDATTYPPETGLTVSFTTPASWWQITDYRYTGWEQWGGLLWLLWPVAIFWGAVRIWRRYGRDIKITKAHMVQYEPPRQLNPYEAYQLQHNGSAGSTALAGTIVGLAVKGYLKLERQRRGLLGKQIVFTCEKAADDKLSPAEREVMGGLFGSGMEVGATVQSSKLRSAFRTAVLAAQKDGQNWLKKEGLFENQTGRLWPWWLAAVAGLMLAGATVSSGVLGWIGIPATLVGLVVIIWFTVLMPRRTEAGAEVEWQLRGFQDYLKTAEKYRLQFSEKENLFEKYLPYAVTFGVVTEWARAMRQLYGEEYWSNYHPVWFVGPFDVTDVASFSAEINSVASDISSAMSAGTSGGSSGGGAGGGGGGSW